MKWRLAMDVEIGAIEKNDTWELTKILVEAKKIEVNWVYKTKFNDNGEVEKYKARLVAKGLVVFQLDVKSAFLHGKLSEEVFIEQPLGHEVKGVVRHYMGKNRPPKLDIVELSHTS
ncbi:retrovirus-related pol polyprotein from transposon TNT 1-94 [Tanacetum coccineum]